MKAKLVALMITAAAVAAALAPIAEAGFRYP